MLHTLYKNHKTQQNIIRNILYIPTFRFAAYIGNTSAELQAKKKIIVKTLRIQKISNADCPSSFNILEITAQNVYINHSSI